MESSNYIEKAQSIIATYKEKSGSFPKEAIRAAANHGMARQMISDMEQAIQENNPITDWTPYGLS